MKQIKTIAVGLLLGSLSLAEAVKLRIPDYWDPFYADTWRYTKDPHLVDADQWTGDAPSAYTTLQLGKVPDFYANGYSDTWKHTEKAHIVDRNQWVDDAPEAYTVAALVQKNQRKHYESAHDKWPVYQDGQYRKSAWTDEQHSNSNEEEWEAETKAPTGYQVTPSSFAERKTYPSKDSHSWLEPYSQRDHSWNIEEHDQSDEKAWGHETNHPSGYQVTPDSFAQRKTYPSKDSHSWLEPYSQRDHSWNIEEHDQSDEKAWGHETNHPSGYQVTPDSFAQASRRGALLIDD